MFTNYKKSFKYTLLATSMSIAFLMNAENVYADETVDNGTQDQVIQETVIVNDTTETSKSNDIDESKEETEEIHASDRSVTIIKMMNDPKTDGEGTSDEDESISDNVPIDEEPDKDGEKENNQDELDDSESDPEPDPEPETEPEQDPEPEPEPDPEPEPEPEPEPDPEPDPEPEPEPDPQPEPQTDPEPAPESEPEITPRRH